MLRKFLKSLQPGYIMSDGTCKAVVAFNEEDSDGPARYSDITVFVRPDLDKTLAEIEREAVANAEAYMREALQSF